MQTDQENASFVPCLGMRLVSGSYFYALARVPPRAGGCAEACAGRRGARVASFGVFFASFGAENLIWGIENRFSNTARVNAHGVAIELARFSHKLLADLNPA